MKQVQSVYPFPHTPASHTPVKLNNKLLYETDLVQRGLCESCTGPSAPTQR